VLRGPIWGWGWWPSVEQRERHGMDAPASGAMMHPMFAWPPAASDRPAARPSAAERDLAERDENEVHDDHDSKRRGIWERR